MRKKLLLTLASAACCAAFAFGLASCGEEVNQFEDVYELYVAYAEDSGSTVLSYEEWLDSIAGSDGVGIASIALNEDGEVVVTYTNGSSTNLGSFKGADGKDGSDGTDGADGADGADGKDGSVVTIGEDGYWYIDGVKTEVKAVGEDGEDGNDGSVVTIGENGNWFIDGVDSGVLAKGTNGNDGNDGKDGSVVTIGEDGYWYIDGEDTGVLAKGTNGEDGNDGADGSVWYNGTYEAMNELTANVGDYYLTTDTYAVYTYTSEGWVLVIESLKGADGEDFSAETETVTVTFDVNGGDETYESITVTKGECIDIENLPEPKKDGYTFVGWYTGTSVNAGQVTDLTPISRDITLVAKWEKCESFTITSLYSDYAGDSEDYVSLTTQTGYGISFAADYSTYFPLNSHDLVETIIVMEDGTEYYITDAYDEGIVSYFYIYNETYSFWGYISFAQAGEYTAYFTYDTATTFFTAVVEEYVFESEVCLNYANYSGIVYNSTEIEITDYATDYWYDLMISFEAPYDASVSVTLGGETVNDYDTDWYQGSFYVYLQLKSLVNNTLGTYTFVVTISSDDYGSSSVTVTYNLEQVPDFYYYQAFSSSVYMYDSTYFDLYYYGEEEFEYPVVTISYNEVDYTLSSNDGGIFYVSNGEEETDTMLLAYTLYFENNRVFGYVEFYIEGEYTITIAFGNDSDSFTVTATEYVYEYGRDAIEFLMAAWEGNVEEEYYYSGDTITATEGDGYMLGFAFYAPSDSTVSVTITDSEGNAYTDMDCAIEAYEDEFYIYLSTNGSYANDNAGTYTVTITVSAEGYDDVSVTLYYEVVSSNDADVEETE